MGTFFAFVDDHVGAGLRGLEGVRLANVVAEFLAERGHEHVLERNSRSIGLASELVHVLGEASGLRETGQSLRYVQLDEVIEHLLALVHFVEGDELLDQVFVVGKARSNEILGFRSKLEDQHRYSARILRCSRPRSGCWHSRQSHGGC